MSLDKHSERSKQFNISALKFSDEVHDFIAELSRTRRLSDWIAKHAAEDLKRTGALTGDLAAYEGNIMQELQEIKQLLLQGGCQFISISKPTDVQLPVIQKISNDQLTHTIDEEDLNYNF